MHRAGGHPGNTVSLAQLNEKPCAEISPEIIRKQLTAVISFISDSLIIKMQLGSGKCSSLTSKQDMKNIGVY